MREGFKGNTGSTRFFFLYGWSKITRRTAEARRFCAGQGAGQVHWICWALKIHGRFVDWPLLLIKRLSFSCFFFRAVSLHSPGGLLRPLRKQHIHFRYFSCPFHRQVPSLTEIFISQKPSVFNWAAVKVKFGPCSDLNLNIDSWKITRSISMR